MLPAIRAASCHLPLKCRVPTLGANTLCCSPCISRELDWKGSNWDPPIWGDSVPKWQLNPLHQSPRPGSPLRVAHLGHTEGIVPMSTPWCTWLCLSGPGLSQAQLCQCSVKTSRGPWEPTLCPSCHPTVAALESVPTARLSGWEQEEGGEPRPCERGPHDGSWLCMHFLDLCTSFYANTMLL